MLFCFYTHEPGPCHAHEHDVQLLVYVLPDAPSRFETHQVGVEVLAPFEFPDDPRASSGSRSELAQVLRIALQWSPLLSLGSLGIRDLEAAARSLTTLAPLVDGHARFLCHAASYYP
jgi:hypothetical protein